MENAIKMDDLGVPVFLETPIYKQCKRHQINLKSTFYTPEVEPYETCSSSFPEVGAQWHHGTFLCFPKASWESKATFTPRNSRPY